MRRHFQLLKLKIIALFRLAWKQRGFWLRGFLCWSVGMIVLLVDQGRDFDLRFHLRGPQKTSQQTVLVTIDKKDWMLINHQQQSWVRFPRDIKVFSDSFFWNFKVWESVLAKILAQDPKAIGVSLYFGDNVPSPTATQLNSKVFNSEKIIWATNLDSEGRPRVPLFTLGFNNNIGLHEYVSSTDGVVRKFTAHRDHVDHLGLKVATLANGNTYPDLRSPENELSINFLGSADKFTTISFSDVFNGLYREEVFKDRVVLIGPVDFPGQTLLTPIGSLSRLETLANVIENLSFKKTIVPVPLWISGLYLTLILLVSFWILSSFPQSMGFVFLLWFGTASYTFSLWVFDNHFYWLPVLAPVVMLITTYVVFLSFQVTIKDIKNWRLEEERKNILQYEQLKNNFVSLISHDLKTPIAKLQAISDRILLEHSDNPKLREDLSSLRDQSVELNRYIQTIIHVTRVESKDFSLNRDTTDINEIIDSVITKLSPLAMAKRISIKTDLEPLFMIEIDHILISEVILNIIENAIKYTPEEGTINVTSREIDDRVYVHVKDSGEGISKDDQHRIFDKFYRAEDANPRASGSGLGLYLVKYFVELHGGETTLESQKGLGTKVSISLPVQNEAGD